MERCFHLSIIISLWGHQSDPYYILSSILFAINQSQYSLACSNVMSLRHLTLYLSIISHNRLPNFVLLRLISVKYQSVSYCAALWASFLYQYYITSRRVVNPSALWNMIEINAYLVDLLNICYPTNFTKHLTCYRWSYL